jgi:hypothetical protein
VYTDADVARMANDVQYDSVPYTTGGANALYEVAANDGDTVPGTFTFTAGRTGAVVNAQQRGIQESVYNGNNVAYGANASTGSAQSSSTNTYDMTVPGMRSPGAAAALAAKKAKAAGAAASTSAPKLKAKANRAGAGVGAGRPVASHIPRGRAQSGKYGFSSGGNDEEV